MYFMPEAYNTRSHLRTVVIDDVRVYKSLYTEKCIDFHGDMEELVRLLKPDYLPPTNASEALSLFTELILLLENY